jgi:ABC-2 type transport system ATP-binding protein
MSQKVQFLCAIVPTPRLLMLDEPFTGLDPVSAEQIRAAVLELRQQGATIILSTHDMTVAETLCDSLFMIYRSRKVLDGTLESIQAEYGANLIRVATARGLLALEALPGVESIRDLGRLQELRLAPGTDPQHVLRLLIARTPISHFELARPSLQEIFVRLAQPAPEAVALAA